ncbi:RipA family octameric membrane protein [Streptomyces sp. GDS52]|uniref:RipA family octameric membrane protein n=1 Tax=Streptomyces sp. GDS52 TaxID=3406419 RepID=UPI003FD3988F
MNPDLADPEALTELDTRLWNGRLGIQDYDAAGEKYQAAILEQYKLYVEMADRISARRSLTNTFFLTTNAALLTAAGAVSGTVLQGMPTWGLVVAGLVAVGQCGAWFLLIASYRQLNRAKYKVIGALERRLPARLYDAEWGELGAGKTVRLYVPLTLVELWIPALFMVFYVAAGAAALQLA